MSWQINSHLEFIKKIYLLAGSKSNKAIIIDIEAQWIEACNINIESEVELVAVDEKRPWDVLLDYDWSLLWHMLPLVDDTNANTSGRRRLTHTHKQTNTHTHNDDASSRRRLTHTHKQTHTHTQTMTSSSSLALAIFSTAHFRNRVPGWNTWVLGPGVKFHLVSK